MSTKIDWATEVWNPVTGCTKISAGCANCYAERQARMHQYHTNPKIAHTYRKGFKPTEHIERLGDPLAWKRERRVFVCSMGDLFHEQVRDGFIRSVWSTMALTRQHKFLVLTKRPDRMEQWLLENQAGIEPLENVALGTSIESMEHIDRAFTLLRCPAALHFVSCEPLLEEVSLLDVLPPAGLRTRTTPDWHQGPAVRWVIAGGESGNSSRPMNPKWVRRLQEECRHRAAFFFKQWGGWRPATPETAHRVLFDGEPMTYQGKKDAGYLLDGRAFREMPEEVCLGGETAWDWRQA